MASITTRNSRRSKSITSPLEGMDVEGLSHSAVKLHVRKMKPTSRVIPAREQYNDAMKDDHPQTKLHDTPQPKRFGATMPQEYGAIKLSAEIGSVHDALNKMNDMVAKRRTEVAVERDKATDEALKAKEFTFQKKEDELSPKALKAIRLVVREELANAGGAGGSGLADSLLALGGGLLGSKIPGLPKGPGKGPVGPTGPAKVPTVPTPQPTASSVPTALPVPSGGGAKPVPTVGRGRAAYDKAGRMGSIFRRTVEKKGLSAGISRIGSIMSPGGAAGGFATKAAGMMAKGIPLLGLGLYGLDAVQQKEGLDELLDNGAISKEDYDKAVKELTAKKVGGALGIGASMLAGAAIGSAVPIVGTAVGAVGGLALGIGATIGGEKLGLMAVDEKRQKDRQAENWNKFNETNKQMGLPTIDPQTVPVPKPVKKHKSEKIPLPTRDKTQPVPEGVVESIKEVSKSFDIPYEEMVATAEQESGLNPKAKNPESSATGLFQHTTDTWNRLVQKFPEVAQEYDIKKVSLMRDDRMDPYKSSVMYAILRKDDQAILKGATTGYSIVDTYLTHLLGAPTAKAFLVAYQQNPNQLITSVRGMTYDVLNKNINIFKGQGRWFTLEEVVQRIKTIKTTKLDQGMKRIAKSEKLRQEGSTTSSASVNPASSTAGPKEPSQTVSAPTAKISPTPARIEQTAEATKVQAQANQKPVQPVILTAPANQPAMMPMIPQQPVGANLTTRNDNPYVQGVKLQEAMRQK